MLGEKIELTDHVDSIYDFILDVDYKYQEIIMKLFHKIIAKFSVLSF